MFRFILSTSACLVLCALSGCACGPQCNDCSGCGHAGFIAHRPLDSVRHWRRSLTCGAGCGETYYDEWTSTPPDCCEPCPEFAGGGCISDCGPCGDCGGHCGVVGGCGIRPLRAAARLVKAVYGKRYCDGCGYDTGDCCCGETSVYDSYDSGCGCASCGGAGANSAPGCANGDCGVAKSAPGMPPIQVVRPQQMAGTQPMIRPDLQGMPKNRKAQTPIQPSANSPIRQAQRIPEGPVGLRR